LRAVEAARFAVYAGGMLTAILLIAFLLALSALLASVFWDGLKEGRLGATTVADWPLLYWPMQVVIGSVSLTLLVAGLGLLGSWLLGSGAP
jgi:hypothetical protein